MNTWRDPQDPNDPYPESGFSPEMQRALEQDGEKLRQLTGEDHGPVFVHDATDRPVEQFTEINPPPH